MTKRNQEHTGRCRISQRFAISGFSKRCMLLCCFLIL